MWPKLLQKVPLLRRHLFRKPRQNILSCSQVLDVALTKKIGTQVLAILCQVPHGKLEEDVCHAGDMQRPKYLANTLMIIACRSDLGCGEVFRMSEKKGWWRMMVRTRVRYGFWSRGDYSFAFANIGDAFGLHPVSLQRPLEVSIWYRTWS